MKKGYYVAILIGGGAEAVLWSDGERLFSHGVAEAIDPGLLAFISEEPLELMTIPDVVFKLPKA